jgi:hypothetical protein
MRKEIHHFHGNSKPGSLNPPLMNSRSNYIGSPNSYGWKVITLLKGQYIFFDGDVAHGGCTYNEASWHAAIHLHVDTIHNERTTGIVAFANEQEATNLLRSQWNSLVKTMAAAHAGRFLKFVLGLQLVENRF